jgi:hypothetical protein
MQAINSARSSLLGLGELSPGDDEVETACRFESSIGSALTIEPRTDNLVQRYTTAANPLLHRQPQTGWQN